MIKRKPSKREGDDDLLTVILFGTHEQWAAVRDAVRAAQQKARGLRFDRAIDVVAVVGMVAATLLAVLSGQEALAMVYIAMVTAVMAARIAVEWVME